MSRREEFLARWNYGGYRPEAEYTENEDGCSVRASISWTESDGAHGVSVGGAETLSPTADEAWAKADAAMVERFGEPEDTSREAFRAVAARFPAATCLEDIDKGMWVVKHYGMTLEHNIRTPEQLDIILRGYRGAFQTERDVKLCRADAFMQRCAERQRQTGKAWAIDVNYQIGKKARCHARCVASAIYSKAHDDWLDAVLDIIDLVDAEWAHHEEG